MSHRHHARITATVPEEPVLYPRLAQYVRVEYDGKPFTTNENLNFQPLDYAKIQKLAANDIITFHPPNLNTGGVDDGGANGDIVRTLLAQIKVYNPRIKILLYLDGGQPFTCASGWYGAGTAGTGFVPPDGDDPTWCSNNNFLWERWVAIGRQTGIVYRQEAPVNTNFGWAANPALLATNFTKPSVQTAMADIMLNWFGKQSEYDGIFCDEVGGRAAAADITWMENGSQHIDFARDGFGSLGAWNTAYGNGVNTFYNRLRQGLPSTKILIGNVGQTVYTNGGTRENWPLQDPANATIAKYLEEQTTFRSPQTNWLTQWRDVTVPTGTPLTTNEFKRAREMVGVATLSEGYGMITGGLYDISHGWTDHWLDEYSVVNGVCTTAYDTSGKHWLGARVTAATTEVHGIYYSTFQHGLVACNRTGLGSNFTLPAGSYKRLLGSQLGNDGSAVGATLFMNNGTAVFLWKD